MKTIKNIGCFLIGWNNNILSECGEASQRQFRKLLSAICIMMLMWGTIGYCFADRYINIEQFLLMQLHDAHCGYEFGYGARRKNSVAVNRDLLFPVSESKALCFCFADGIHPCAAYSRKPFNDLLFHFEYSLYGNVKSYST